MYAMLVFSDVVLLLALISVGLPSTLSTETAKRELPEKFIGVFRNDLEKENHKNALSAVFGAPRQTADRESNFFRIERTRDGVYEYCLSLYRICIPFRLQESLRLRGLVEVTFNLTDDQTILKGIIRNEEEGYLQVQLTVSDKGVEILSTYGNHSHPGTSAKKAFYERTLRWYVLGMFEVDSERTTQETLDKANSVFRPLNPGGSYKFSTDTRLWLREMYEGRFVRATLFSAAYQWSSGFSLFENETAYHNLFNGTINARSMLEKSAQNESVLLSQVVSADGRYNLTDRTVFEENAVKESLTFNGEQVTIYYRRIVEDLFYGSYEEVAVPGEEGLSAFLNMACTGSKSGASLNISRNVDRTYSLDITPCKEADTLHIPFILNNSTEFTVKQQQDNVTAKAYFTTGEGGPLFGKLYNFLPQARVQIGITPDVPKDHVSGAWTGILFSVSDGRRPTRSYKFRRVFPSYIFGSFDSTNDTSDVTKSVLEFSQNAEGNLIEKRSTGHANSTTTSFAGARWTDLDTGTWDIFFYYEFAGDGVPAILKLRYQDEFPYRLIWAETMIFKPNGVEMHATIAKENKNTKQFYARRPSVKS